MLIIISIAIFYTYSSHNYFEASFDSSRTISNTTTLNNGGTSPSIADTVSLNESSRRSPKDTPIISPVSDGDNFTITEAGIDSNHDLYVTACRSSQLTEEQTAYFYFNASNSSNEESTLIVGTFEEEEDCITRNPLSSPAEMDLPSNTTYLLEVVAFPVLTSNEYPSNSEVSNALTDHTSNYYSTNISIPTPVEIMEVSMESDYTAFTVSICDQNASELETFEVTFTTNNNKTETTEVTLSPSQRCANAIIETDQFRILTPYHSDTLTVEVAGAIAAFDYEIIPDLALSNLTIGDNNATVIVCAIGTDGMELTEIHFDVPDKLTEVIGVTVPEHNTCETFNVSFDETEFALLESGDVLYARITYPGMYEAVDDIINNNVYVSY